MSQFQEDMIFKNVGEEDARILLDIIGKKSKKVKIWTKELRLLDPAAFKPDIILELDDEILIIEFQSTKVGKRHLEDFMCMDLKGFVPSFQALVFEIEWLIVDKFVENENARNILQDLLGDRMSMVLKLPWLVEAVDF